MRQSIAEAWTRLRSKQWSMFAAGAALMLAGWHLYTGQTGKVPVDLLLTVFFLLK